MKNCPCKTGSPLRIPHLTTHHNIFDNIRLLYANKSSTSLLFYYSGPHFSTLVYKNATLLADLPYKQIIDNKLVAK